MSTNAEFRYRTAIFDLDGTLLYTLPDLRTAVNATMAQYGWSEQSVEEVRRKVGNGIRRLLIACVPDGEQNPQFAAAFSTFQEEYGRHQFDTTGPYDGIPEVLAACRARGVKTAIVSNKIDFAVKDLNDRFFHMDVAVGDREGWALKPAPDSTLAAMEKLGADPATTVYIGDSEVDVLTARNAGLPCLTALWGFRDRLELEAAGATTFVERPEDLLCYF